MKIIKYRIALFSEDPDNLAHFYRDIPGFKQIVEVNSYNGPHNLHKGDRLS
jgi:hypothetical protein